MDDSFFLKNALCEEITLRDLKYILHYTTDIELLASEHCDSGQIFFLRKAHLSKIHGFNFGKDVLIVNPQDFSDL